MVDTTPHGQGDTVDVSNENYDPDSDGYVENFELPVEDNGAEVLARAFGLDFGTDLGVTDNGDGTVTIAAQGASTDTHTDVSDDGTTVVSNVDDINFDATIAVADDGDGTVTVTSVERTDVSDDSNLVVSNTEDINFGNNLSVTNDGDGTVTITGSSDTDTHTDVSDDGTLVQSDTGDVNFGTGLSATADGDGTATVSADAGSGSIEASETDDGSDLSCYQTEDSTFSDGQSITLLSISGSSGVVLGGQAVHGANGDAGQLEITVDGGTTQTYSAVLESVTGTQLSVPPVKFDSSITIVFNSLEGGNSGSGFSGWVWVKQ